VRRGAETGRRRGYRQQLPAQLLGQSGLPRVELLLDFAKSNRDNSRFMTTWTRSFNKRVMPYALTFKIPTHIGGWLLEQLGHVSVAKMRPALPRAPQNRVQGPLYLCDLVRDRLEAGSTCSKRLAAPPQPVGGVQSDLLAWVQGAANLRSSLRPNAPSHLHQCISRRRLQRFRLPLVYRLRLPGRSSRAAPARPAPMSGSRCTRMRTRPSRTTLMACDRAASQSMESARGRRRVIADLCALLDRV
jgi:hypothetical protein